MRNRQSNTKGLNTPPVYGLSYDDLQEVHVLVGLVCGWKMSLPKKMIRQAKEVERRMIALKIYFPCSSRQPRRLCVSAARR